MINGLINILLALNYANKGTRTPTAPRPITPKATIPIPAHIKHLNKIILSMPKMMLVLLGTFDPFLRLCSKLHLSNQLNSILCPLKSFTLIFKLL